MSSVSVQILAQYWVWHQAPKKSLILWSKVMHCFDCSLTSCKPLRVEHLAQIPLFRAIKLKSDLEFTYQEIHHVGFIVSQCFDSVEHIHRALVLKHFTHNTNGTEGPAASASVPEKKRHMQSSWVIIHRWCRQVALTRKLLDAVTLKSH